MVSLNDRRRAENLIVEEFRRRISETKVTVTEEEKKAIREEFIRVNKLQPKIDAIEALEKQLDDLKIKLSESLQKLRGQKKKRRNWCECHESYKDVLTEIIGELVEKRENSRSGAKDKLVQDRQQMLLKIETAPSAEAISKVLSQLITK